MNFFTIFVQLATVKDLSIFFILFTETFMEIIKIVNAYVRKILIMTKDLKKIVTEKYLIAFTLFPYIKFWKITKNFTL